MPSLHPGFEYDIFISYRQNDNRSGWVTEFVKALEEELASTIKDPVSIYFDVNPHDGLLETHNVHKSLEGKLKCLIFIPIISQTYCDPKSFAWQHEFCSFNKIAKEDLFGRDIKLSSGNVTSRILPIKIHDLDKDDQALIEEELEGPLRAIEFIFKSSGVNRPLRPNEEEPKENLNHTLYRNQINKVAQAAKEVMGALQRQSLKGAEVPIENNARGINNPPKERRLSSLMKPTSLIILGLLVVAALTYFGMRNSRSDNPSAKYNYDLAVMYLENFTENQKYGDQLASLIYINLSEDTSLRVIPRQKLYDEMKVVTGEAQFPDRTHSSEIAEKTGVKTMLTGSIHQQNEKALVQLELIEVATGKVLKSEKLEGNIDQIFKLADDISKRIARSAMRKEFNVTLRTTDNYQAYQAFYSGLESFYGWRFPEASAEFKQAILIDSTFALGYLFLAQTTNINGLLNPRIDLRESKELIRKAEKYSYKLSDRDQKLIRTYSYMYEGNFIEADKIAREICAVDPTDRDAFLAKSLVAAITQGPGFIPEFEEYARLNPSLGFEVNILAYANAEYGNPDHAFKEIKRYMDLEPNNPNAFQSAWEVCLIINKPEQALIYLEKFKELNGKNFSQYKGQHYLTLNEPEKLQSHLKSSKDSLPNNLSFQELLPNSLMLEGKFKEAIIGFDNLAKRFESTKNWDFVLRIYLHKGMAFMTMHQYGRAKDEFKKIFGLSRSNNPLSPDYFLGLYFTGLVNIGENDIASAMKSLRTMESLLETGQFDWRFASYPKILQAEIELSQGSFDKARRTKDKMLWWFNMRMPSSLNFEWNYAWKTKNYEYALTQLIPFQKNYLRCVVRQGGEQTHFTCERAFADYNIARIYEDSGNQVEAVKYYDSFLTRFRNSDPGIPEKEDAERRVMALKSK